MMKTSPQLIVLGLLTATLPSFLLFHSINTLFFVPILFGLMVAAAGAFHLSEQRRHLVSWLGMILCISAAVGPFIARAWGERSGYPIKIVLPTGYQGHFSILRNPILGQEVPFENSCWVFRIPANGVLRVKEDSAFFAGTV